MEQEGSAFCKRDVAVVVGDLQGINKATFYRAHPSSHPLLDYQEFTWGEQHSTCWSVCRKLKVRSPGGIVGRLKVKVLAKSSSEDEYFMGAFFVFSSPF